jgi:hypothetical protein
MGNAIGRFKTKDMIFRLPESEDELPPKFHKRGRKRKRKKPYRLMVWGFLASRRWRLWQRYDTRKKAEQALKAKTRSDEYLASLNERYRNLSLRWKIEEDAA